MVLWFILHFFTQSNRTYSASFLLGCIHLSLSCSLRQQPPYKDLFMARAFFLCTTFITPNPILMHSFFTSAFVGIKTPSMIQKTAVHNCIFVGRNSNIQFVQRFSFLRHYHSKCRMNLFFYALMATAEQLRCLWAKSNLLSFSPPIYSKRIGKNNSFLA